MSTFLCLFVKTWKKRNEAYLIYASYLGQGGLFLFYNTSMKVYKDGTIKQRIYGKMLYRKEENEATEQKKTSKGRISLEDSKYKELRKDNLIRSRNTLIDYVCQNPVWKSFVTLTFADNIKDIDYANRCFSNWIRSVKRIFPNLKYIGVPEFQKRGAVHYHLLLNIPVNSDIIQLQKEKKNMYDIKFWEYGFTSAFDLSNTDEDFNIALYITKYLYKDMDNRLFGRNKILKSNNLEKPDIIYLIDTSITYQNAIDYIKCKYDVINKYEVVPTSDKVFIKPFIGIDYYNSITDNSTLMDILKEN